MHDRLVPYFNSRIFKAIRKEKSGYYSFAVSSDGSGNVQPFLMNETGYRVVKLCDGKRGVPDIISEMIKSYKKVSPTTLKSDIESFLGDITNYGSLIWIGKGWTPRSPWVDKIGNEILAVCDPQCGFLVSKFMANVKNKHFALLTDDVGHILDPIMHCGDTPSVPITIALLDQEYDFKIVIMFRLVDYGSGSYLNFDRIDLRSDSDIEQLGPILNGSVRILNALFSKEAMPSRVRVWVREKLPLKEGLQKCFIELGFSEEVTFDTGYGSTVTGYSQNWSMLLEEMS